MPLTSPASPPHAPQTPAAVLAHYRTLLAERQADLATAQRRQSRALLALAAVLLFLAAVAVTGGRHHLAAWPLLLSFAAVAILLVLLLRLQTRITRARRRVLHFEDAIARTDGTVPYTSHHGEEAAAPFAHGHLYLRDLDLTGERSLFSLLATTRTGVGQRGLLRLLLEPATHEQALARQAAVRELTPQTGLREQLALLGESIFQQLPAQAIDAWLDEPTPTFHPGFRIALYITAALNAALVLAGLIRFRPWAGLWQPLLAVGAIQSAIALLMRPRAVPLLEIRASLQRHIRLLAEGIDLLQRATFSSPRLVALQHATLEPAGAVRALRQLDSSLVLIEQRKKELFYVFSLLFAAGSQAAISVARWKRRHAAEARAWLDAWAEFEALNALATYAFEHPENAWPELLPPTHAPVFHARDLGHPLLPEGVRNSITLGATDPTEADHSLTAAEQARFLLISGSNMAGKSTLLRSIGLAAVLAYAGAPVRASSLRLTPLRLGASIALTDSLAEGKSKFLAEVERLAAIASQAQTHPVLFLIDEIFSGTNSADRHAAAEAVLSRLLAHQAIGALSTHDLALTALATAHNAGRNVHMSSPDDADPLAFDYRLKPGINRSSSAQAIIRMLGLVTS